jgi:hypothetical protein
MPPRIVTWAILFFWLATSVWLFCREYLPRMQANKPPVFFTPQFADEVRARQLRWTIFQDREEIGSPRRSSDRIGSGTTEFRRKKNRLFEISCELSFSDLEFSILRIQRMRSAYRVGPAGELRELEAQVTFAWDKTGVAVEFGLTGKVGGDQFTSRLHLPAPMKRDWQLDPVKVSPEESFLNPLHPLDKVYGLYEGRHWRIHLINPLEGLTTKLSLFDKSEINTLECDVAEEKLVWEGRQETCWVIDYHPPGKGKAVARTWVRQNDSSILRQEAKPFGNRMIIDRGVHAR